MPTNNNFIDGTGKFQQNTENAGVITYGEFSQAARNTGTIAYSAIFTGTAVNSGTIGNYLPFQTAALVQANSAQWDAAFAAQNDFVLLNDSRLIDARVPLAHTQPMSSIDGLSAALVILEAQIGQGGAIAVTTADITDFKTAVDDLIALDSPVLSVAGKTGEITLSASDIQGLAAAVIQYAPSQAVSSVAGKTGAVTLSTSDIQGFNTNAAAQAPVQSVAGRTGAVSVSASDVVGLAAQITSGAPVTSVAGKTGVVTLSTSDVQGFNANAAAQAPVQSVAGRTGAVVVSASDVVGLAAQITSGSAVTSVAGKTGTVTLSTSDVQGFNTNAAAQAPVQSVAGRTGAVVISAADVAGFSAAADARITAAAGVSVASLVGGLIPSSQLPSYVDDVLEYTNVAGFPGTGETGKIYVSTSTNKTYRWSGSAYIEIAASPGSTDSVTEGSTNLYFTNARAAAAAPVQSVAGKTGTVTLSTSDIQGLSSTYLPLAGGTLTGGLTGTNASFSSNVGIGTSAPVAKLDVVGDIATVTNSYIASNLYYNSGWKYKTNGTGGFIKLAEAGTGAIILATAPENSSGVGTAAAASERMRITTDGKVGINEVNPWGMLDVVKSQNSATAIYTNNQDQGSSAEALIRLGTYGGQWSLATGSIAKNSNALTFTQSYYGEAFRITADGKVGIGTTSPSQLLHVSKTQNGAPTIVKVENASTANNSAARFDMATGTSASYGILSVTENSTIGNYTEWSAGAGVTGGTWITSGTTSAPIVLRQASSERLRIDASGNVGIGTSTPAAKLEVLGATLGSTAGSTSDLLMLSNSNGNVNHLKISQIRNANGYDWSATTTRIQQVTDVTNQAYIDFNPNGQNYGLAFGVGVNSSVEALRILANGNVGVGTTTPNQKLTVVGSISATGSVYGDISANSLSMSNAMLSTYTTPVTASGDFLVITVGNTQRLIRIWDFK